LQRYGGNAPERDETESLLIKYSIENKIPLIGVCRGMQKILDYFGETLEKVTDHVGVEHSIFFKGQNRKVNSYHNWGVKEISSQFNVLAKSVDGCIESIEHKEHSILGVMWHPERNLEFENLDIDLFKSWLREKK
jgi:gamma-glutamyl-gamma-aminobutyrate hydrolase PuuD